MNPLLAQLLIQLGAILIMRLIKSDDDTSALEAEIAATKTKEDVEAIAVREGLDVLTKAVDKPVAELIADLAETQKSGDVVKVVEKHRVNILKILADFIGGLFKWLG